MLSFIISKCDAPRNNPLDPNSESKPLLENFSVYSIVRNKYPDIKTYRVAVSAQIKDDNNIIDSVFISNPYLKIEKSIFYNVNQRLYEREFFLSELNTTAIDDIIGHDFILKMKDYLTNISELGIQNLKRVIKDEIQIDSPLGGVNVSSTPTLIWKKFTVPYTFSFTIQVYTSEQELIWERKSVSPDSTSVLINFPLPNDEYYWIIWCVDQFNNMGSSKPATFKVVN